MPALRGQAALDYLKEKGLYDSLEQAVAAARYQVRDDGCSAEGDSSFSAENPAQAMTARFDGRSFTAQSRSAAGEPWNLSMRPVGIGYGKQRLPLSEGAISIQGDRIEIARDRLLEWYVNRPAGVEQGFTLFSKPTGGSGIEPLRLVMEWNGDLNPRVIRDGQGIALERGEGRRTLVYDRLSVIDASGLKLASRFEVEGHDVAIVVEDREATYPLTIDPVLTQIAELTASDGSVSDRFGYSVSVEGDTAVVGAVAKAVGANSSQGAAYVFARNSGGADGWGQVKELTASDGAKNDGFGNSVSVEGDTVVVGAAGKDVGTNLSQGGAYVFARNSGGANNWGEVKILTASDGGAQDLFGWSVSIDGDTAVVGAFNKTVGGNGSQGGAYVFERNSGGADNWGQVQILTASDGAANDRFGLSVSIDGDTALVGAYEKTVAGNAFQGAAYVFERNGGGAENWGQVHKLISSDGAQFDQFGFSVSIEGDAAVVGANGKSANQGAAYVFERNSGGVDNWGEVKKLTDSFGTTNDAFGASVSIDGDTVVVGASAKNSLQGAAFVFERNSGGADSWGQVQVLTASDGAAGDDFGLSVSVDRNTALLGAPGKSSLTGAAYVFAGICNNFAQVAEPIGSDTVNTDAYGNSVSISGDTAVVGAPGAGAAYVFERNTGGADGWGEVKKLTASGGASSDFFGHSVSIDGDTAVVGAFGKSYPSMEGAAYVYQRNLGGAENWGQVTILTASDAASGDHFGLSVAIQGDTAIVGAPDKNGSTGAAYVFERNTGGAENWGQVQELTGSDGTFNDQYGVSVSIDGHVAVVGAPHNDDQGGAYMYERNVGGADNWGQLLKLFASDGAANDNFGNSVSISGDTVAVGANGKTVGGNLYQGAAYIFARNQDGPDAWGQVQEMTASDGAELDQLGFSVSIDGDTLVAGAFGVDGFAGAAYVFERNTGGADNWGQVTKITASDRGAGEYFGFSAAIDGPTVSVGAVNKSASYIFACSACISTTTTVTNASTQYSDPVDLTATVSSTGTVNTGTVKFTIVETGDVVGTANVVSGTATLAKADQTLSSTTGHYPDLAQGIYTIQADYSGTSSLCLSTNTGTLTVSREDAIVTPSASNLCSVKVNSPGGTAGPVTLCADITEATDESYDGEISNAVPVTFTLIPVVGAGTLGPLTATTSGGGIGGTLHACATFSTIPVNVYTVVITVGGNDYTGTGYSVLAIYDPSLGFVGGGGILVNPNTGRRANFGFTAKYLKKGGVQGSGLYIEHLPGGGITTIKAGSLKSLSIVGSSAVILSKSVKFNGTPSYGFQITAVDNGDPGRTDQFGLKLTNPNGSTNATYTFPLQTLQGGNIQVPHK